ncbi:HD domain-containing protein [Oceanidesulfovibrio indonesiensis]|nr:HD domain-containing protein [Oceanidesulfovibrio indonesiensis]
MPTFESDNSVLSFLGFSPYAMNSESFESESALDPTQAPPQPLAPFEPAGAMTPDATFCRGLWDRFGMPEHIREHSRLVSQIAHGLARAGREAGAAVNPNNVLACGLLHDIAKDFTIRHGGNHAVLGAAWALEATRNPVIAQGVMHHVYWPWAVELETAFLPLAIIYADKRVRHDAIVSLEDRFDDLMARYGKNESIRARIRISQRQAEAIGSRFSSLLGTDVNACSFDSGRLV